MDTGLVAGDVVSTKSEQQPSSTIGTRTRERRVYRLFTDGSSIGTSPGGVQWGGSSFVFEFRGEWLGRFFGIGKGITSETAELHAIWKALEWAFELRLEDAELFTSVEIFCDSKWVVNDIKLARSQQVVPRAMGKKVIDELEWLHQLECDVAFTYVKGHNGNQANEFADRLAKRGAMAAKRQGTEESTYEGNDAMPKTRES